MLRAIMHVRALLSTSMLAWKLHLRIALLRIGACVCFQEPLAQRAAAEIVLEYIVGGCCHAVLGACDLGSMFFLSWEPFALTMRACPRVRAQSA